MCEEVQPKRASQSPTKRQNDLAYRLRVLTPSLYCPTEPLVIRVGPLSLRPLCSGPGRRLDGRASENEVRSHKRGRRGVEVRAKTLRYPLSVRYFLRVRAGLGKDTGFLCRAGTSSIKPSSVVSQRTSTFRGSAVFVLESGPEKNLTPVSGSLVWSATSPAPGPVCGRGSSWKNPPAQLPHHKNKNNQNKTKL